MSYTAYITETLYTSVSFDTKEEAEAFMKEPNYNLCASWELLDSNIELGENKWQTELNLSSFWMKNAVKIQIFSLQLLVSMFGI